MKKRTNRTLILLIFVLGLFLVIQEPQKAAGQQEIKIELSQEIDLALVGQGFVSPVDFVSPNDGTGRMFVVDQIGLIRIINSQGETLPGNFLDLRNKLVNLSQNYDERGLLGLSFHPNFKENGRFFVHYSTPLRKGGPIGWNHTGILSEFKINENDPNTADANSEKVILQIDEPQSNHNGGHIAFGPDGYLYFPLGDGGAANDVGMGHPEIGNGQDISTPLGSIFRIDVDRGDPYSIPQDNPFVGKDGLDEIFAFGFRNPYHLSFNSEGNKELFVADVGQNLWEEINIVEKGGNYGWNIKEASHCFDPASPDESPTVCSDTGALGEPLLDPIIEYGRKLGTATVGGYIYRGESIAGLKGNYVFADWSRGFTVADASIFVANRSNGKWVLHELKIANRENNRLGLFIKGVGQDEQGELYILTTEALGPTGDSGKIFKIVSAENISQADSTEIKEQRVIIKDFSFNPQTITVSRGTKVAWRNEDSVEHTATSEGNFNSGYLSQGEEFSFIFESVGSFDYICTLHPFMKGKIIIK